MNQDTKKRLSIVLSTAGTAFHWSFIPVIIYLGTLLNYNLVWCLGCKPKKNPR